MPARKTRRRSTPKNPLSPPGGGEGGGGGSIVWRGASTLTRLALPGEPPSPAVRERGLTSAPSGIWHLNPVRAGSGAAPQPFRGDCRALGHRVQFLERDVGVELAVAGKGAEAA